MRHHQWLLIAVTAFASACGSSVNVPKERDALLAMDREWSQNTKDPDKYFTSYAPDASVYAPGMPIVTGSAAIHDALTKMASAPGFALEFTPTKADLSSSGDLGYTAGTYQLSMNNAEGKPVMEKGKYVTLWKKQPNGQWKAVEDIYNADAPPPPPVPAAKPSPRRPASRRRR